MNNEYPKTKATQFDIETKTLLANVDFSYNNINITLKVNDEYSEATTVIYLENSEQLNDLAVIINKINSLNIEG